MNKIQKPEHNLDMDRILYADSFSQIESHLFSMLSEKLVDLEDYFIGQRVLQSYDWTLND